MPHCIKEGPSPAGRDRSLSDIALMHHAQRPCASATSDPRDPRLTSSDVIRQLPMRVKLRPRRTRRDSSRRDLTKVAQFEVLGWRSKKGNRPGRDDRRLLAFMRGMRETRSQTFLSSLAGRTSLFAPLPSTSCWATFVGPSGTSALRILPSLKLTRMGGRRTTSDRLLRSRNS
jgi:hypothetical protein